MAKSPLRSLCGGFDNLFIQPFGERVLKTFIQTSIDEAVILENALAKLETRRKVAILHYSPIRQTLQGESLEIYPFLGSSRLAYSLDRRGVDVIFHNELSMKKLLWSDWTTLIDGPTYVLTGRIRVNFVPFPIDNRN